MNKEDKYTFLALPLLPARLNALEAAWYLGFQPHEISILVGADLLEPLGHPPANTPKFFRHRITGSIAGQSEVA